MNSEFQVSFVLACGGQSQATTIDYEDTQEEESGGLPSSACAAADRQSFGNDDIGQSPQNVTNSVSSHEPILPTTDSAAAVIET